MAYFGRAAIFGSRSRELRRNLHALQRQHGNVVVLAEMLSGFSDGGCRLIGNRSHALKAEELASGIAGLGRRQ